MPLDADKDEFEVNVDYYERMQHQIEAKIQEPSPSTKVRSPPTRKRQIYSTKNISQPFEHLLPVEVNQVNPEDRKQ